MSLISSLLLDDSPLSASTDVLKYSPDGQIAVVTRGAIYIVTPDLSSSPHIEKDIFRGDRLGWLKTAIHDIGITKAWSDGRTVSQPQKTSGKLFLGRLVDSIGSEGKGTSGAYSVADITEYQISSYGGDDEITAEDLQKCQSCCAYMRYICLNQLITWQTQAIAWSDSLHKEEAFPSTAPCHSLLAVGARSGDVSFFRWDLKADAARYCFSSKVADAWITKLTWSNWRLENRTGSSQFGAVNVLCPAIDLPQRLLAIAKPGFIALCTLPALSENDMAEDPSLDIIKLSSPRTSLASSAVSTCVGMQYIASNDSMVVILAEGSTITITGISQKARVIEQEESGTSTYNLSKAVRRVTGIAENRPLESTEYARIYGVQFMETEKDESVVSVAPHMLPVLAPEWGLTNLNQFADEGHTSLTIDDPFTGQTRLKLSLVQILVNRVSLPENLIVELRSLERTLMQTAVALRIHTVVERIISSAESDEFGAYSCPLLSQADSLRKLQRTLRFQNMRKQGQDYARRHDSSLTYLSNDERDTLDLSRATDLGETCPACQQVVLFQNLAQARCHTGHVWERCATSFRLLASLGSLTCSGCGRKSLDHNPQILAEPGTHCVMCGNRYFRAI
ncbi:zf-TFIIIC domain-containing protein [Rhizoctonia solani AG-1 IA]|uniref:Zf-TFIIIC domain-containing protein n=1 Tax=Thanatephorus cucumeris (strain AG1-IA) TaxID=983506 RepID=L8WZM5_THACA|nr:zf-TFIIIC domain-containing protein [Rhizoctonia solani AG-1 IA]